MDNFSSNIINDSAKNKTANSNIHQQENKTLLEIFFHKKSDKKTLIPLPNKNCGEELKSFFTRNQNITEYLPLKKLTLFYVNSIKEFKNYISNKFDFLQIISNYMSKYQLSPFTFYIDLYLDFITTTKKLKTESNNKDNIFIIKELSDILIWFISSGLLSKNIIDHIYQKYSYIQLEKQMTTEIFETYISLLQIIYGQNSSKNDLISKKYIYLYNKGASMIRTNISPSNKIIIKNGACLVFWFYLNECCLENSQKGTICQFLTETLQKIDFVINSDLDIDIKYNTDQILKEQKNKKFKLLINTWIQLKITFDNKGIKLFLYQKNKKDLKYDVKTYFIYNIEGPKIRTNIRDRNGNMINNYPELKCNNFSITSMNFFLGYEGIVGTIIFCKISNEANNSNIAINSLYGLQNNKIKDFIKNTNLSTIYFILSPVLYSYEDNKFINAIYSVNNLVAELTPENDENAITVNSIFECHNYTNKIFYLGGCVNFLPLFEQLYKFSLIDESSVPEKEINYLLKELIKLLEIVFVNKKNNCLDASKNSNNFFELLQLFLEKIDEKYFNIENNEINNEILISLINIGQYFYKLKKDQILNQNENSDFLTDILFYPKIIIKFKLESQNLIYSFFDNNDIFLKETNYKTCILSFDAIKNLLIIFSMKYPNNSMPNKLFNLIRSLVEDDRTSDQEREILFILCSKTHSENISDNIIINIMEIIIYYFDIKINVSRKSILSKKSFITNNIINNIDENDKLINIRNTSMKYFLYSPNYFLENLLSMLSINKLDIKKSIINILKVLTQKYYNILNDYFSYITQYNKRNPNQQVQRINKKEFYYFISENIIINENNKKLEAIANKKANKKTNKKRKMTPNKLHNKKIFLKKNLSVLSNKRNNSYNINKEIKTKLFKKLRKKIKKQLKENNKKEEEQQENLNINRKRRSMTYRFNTKNKKNVHFAKKLISNKIIHMNIDEINEESETDNSILKSNEQNEQISKFVEPKKNCQISEIKEDINNNIINTSENIINTNKNENEIKKDEDYDGLKAKKENLNEDIDYQLSAFVLIKNSRRYSVIKSRKNNYKRKFTNWNIEKSETLLKDDNKEQIKENENNKNSEKNDSEKKDVKITVNKENNKKDNDNNNVITSKNKNNDKKIIESQPKITIAEEIKINCDISMILYDWLISKELNIYDKNILNRSNNNPLVIDEQIINVINYLVKFISSSKELEVIYRTLNIIFSQKNYDLNINNGDQLNKNNDVYFRLISYFNNSSDFIQLISEITVDSYLGMNNNSYINDKYLNNKNSLATRNAAKSQSQFFIKIFKISKEILLDIYFYEKNTHKNKILYDIINIFLKKMQNFDLNIKSLFFLFLKELFMNISIKFHDLLNNNNLKLEMKFLYQQYIYFISIFFEYSFILNNLDFYSNEKEIKSYKNYINNGAKIILPTFILDGIILDPKTKKWIGYDIYKLILRDIKIIFDLKKIFKDLNIDVSLLTKCKNNIFLFNKKTIIKLLTNFIYNKDFKGKYKDNLEFLFTSYNQSGYLNNFPLVDILILFYSYCLVYYYSDNKEKEFLDLLNELQLFAIYLILISCNIKENEKYLDKKIKFNEIQYIIFQNLLHILKVITYLYSNSNIKDTDNYIIILNNILSLLSNIYITQNEEKEITNNSYADLKKFKSFSNISNSAAYLLIEHLKNLNNIIFNSKNYNLLSININNYVSFNFVKNNIKIIYEFLNQKSNDKENNELYDYRTFRSIYLAREYEINDCLKLLLNNNTKIDITNKYRKLFLKIKSISNNIKDIILNKVEDTSYELLKRKFYRKIKKKLYSFNNSYSNLAVFYNKNTNYELKYKISNFLSKDMTRKFISSIIDFEYYLQNFRHFDYTQKMFQKLGNKKIYSIDCEIFQDELKKIKIEKNEKNTYLIFDNICYIKTTHHICGKIFIKKEIILNNINNKPKSFIFITENLFLSENQQANFEDFDSSHNTCFGSLFRNNLNKKDKEIFLNIKFSEILFIFKRKYCFRDNSIELFLNNHKSYYLKFKNDKLRNKFISEIITNNKNIFKEIKSIDEHENTNILGYYRDNDYLKNYKNISEIKTLWKNNKISTIEYLMWINIYGNRSFRDIAQYPVFPWILNNYENDNIDKILELNENIRDLNLPMGMISLDEKSKNRKDCYLQIYQSMTYDLTQEPNLNFKANVKEDLPEDDNINNEYNIPDFKFNIEKLYYNNKIDFEKIPYIFGSHFSNSMYISLFLVRLFPYASTEIEIQGSGFDCPERLFINLKRTYFGCTHEKCDLRELIPEFYTIPEIFLNINKFNLKKTSEKEYVSFFKNNESLNNESENIINTNEINEEELVQINDVLLPVWSKQNAYFYITKMREILESGIEKNKNININPWIDLIFGYTQRGNKAQLIGNLFLPYSYDGVINFRLQPDTFLKDRTESEYVMRFFELGVNPTKVFKKKCQTSKVILNNQITTNVIKENNFINIYNNSSIYLNVYTRIIFMKNIDVNKLFIVDNRYNGYYVTVQTNNELSDNSLNKVKNNNNYIIKDNQILKNFPLINIEKKNIAYKLIIKSLFNNELFIVTGFYDSALYIMNVLNKTIEKNGYNITNILNSNDNILLQKFGKGLITCLEISKDEKFMICGNENGCLIIYYLNYSSFIDNKKYIGLIKILRSHISCKINSISINSDLNIFADCAIDGYVNIYNLPKCEMINSIYIENKFKIDYIFLSAQPLACIALYSNKNYEFKVFGINGKELENCGNEKDNDLLEKDCNLYNRNEKNKMVSPIIFTDIKFNDYLIYIFDCKFVLIRKFPEMRYILKIKFCENNCLRLINICNNLRYLYVYGNDESKDRIYIIDSKNFNVTTEKRKTLTNKRYTIVK